MQKLRSHIAKLCLISLICTGFSLYMVRPANARQSSKAFSSWLTTVVNDNSSSSDLKQELDEMSKSGANIYKLMEHVSVVMSKTDRNFTLPLESTDASNHILQVLLQQWNHFQTGKGMANIPPTEMVKTLVNISIDKSGTPGFAIVPQHKPGDTVTSYSGIKTGGLCSNTSLDPMTTGIAIGAP